MKMHVEYVLTKLLIAAIVCLAAIAGWFIGGELNQEGMGLALGLIIGPIAGIPAALLVLAAGRRREHG